MQLRVCLLILAGWATAHAVAPAPASNSASQCDCETAKAPIEEVLNVVDDGYRFDAYIVRWHGTRALVSVPLTDGHLKVGDELSFLVMKLKVAGQNLLTFMSLDGSGNAQVAKAMGRSMYNEQRPAAIAAGGEPTTVPITEVLQVEDAGYQQTAYIGQWHGARVAITCMLTCAAYTAGAPLPIVVGRVSVDSIKSLSFQTLPRPGELQAAVEIAQTPTRAEGQMTQESGIVEEVIDSKPDGASYAAYIVQWNGGRIGLPVTSPPPAHHVGESLLLQVVRMKTPPPVESAFLAFEVQGAAPAQDLSAVMKGGMSMSTETGVVESVLSAQDGIYRYRAYVVSFHGARVVVQDHLGSTHYSTGDSLLFAEARSGTAGPHFVLVDFASVRKQATDPGISK